MANRNENTAATNINTRHDALSALVIARSIQEDVVIKELTNELNKTYANAIPTLIVSNGGEDVELKYNGFIEAIATDIEEQIELRKKQIINFYDRNDYDLINNEIQVKVEKDGEIKYYNVEAEPSVHYTSTEVKPDVNYP